jgi:diguanylate cyclase (GGDEF)-like protein/PAS domain S-box-containing protein
MPHVFVGKQGNRGRFMMRIGSLPILVLALLALECATAGTAAGGGPADPSWLHSPVPSWAVIVLTAGLAVALAVLWTRLSWERGRARRRLDDLKNHYDVLAGHSADVIWSVDAALRPTYVSPSVERILGYSQEEFLGRSFRDLCMESSRREFDAFFEAKACDIDSRARWTGEEFVELELLRKDGSAIWTETSRTLLCGDDRDVTGQVCVTREITLRKLAERAFKEEEARFRTLAQHQKDPLLIVDEAGVVEYANSAAQRLFEDGQAMLLGKEFGFPLCAEEGSEISIVGHGGEDMAFEMHCAPIQWNRKPAHVVSLHDVTRRKQMEEELRRSEERYRTVADHTHACESWLGPEGEVLYVSPSCARITGYTLERFSEGPAFMESLVYPEDRELWREHMHTPRGGSVDFRIRHADGRLRWICQASNRVHNAEGTYLGLRCSIRDITSRKLMEEQLRHQSLHDQLTGVGNRTMCLDRIAQGLERSKRRDDYFYAVVFLGLDRFKLINESLGHAFGDKLLMEVSRRLLGGVRELDTVSRFGGDEFVLFLEELASPREAVQIVRRICHRLREPFNIDERQVGITASMGVVLSPADYEKPADLVRNATIAMYRAKEGGRDRFKVFNTRMLESVVHQMHLENDLRRGILNQEFFLVFQPIVGLGDGRLLGFEALLRWQDPVRGVIMPGTFIPAAEETGLIIDLGRWVLEQSCMVLRGMREEQPEAESLFISVNISGRQFSQPGLVDNVRRSLQQGDLPPGCLKLEITETTIMDNAELATEKLHRLKDLGVTLSIDDFGTGYSSLAYLQRFPLDNLKIDISFVRMMERSPENLEIIKAIIDLAHTLGLQVVAEGVENPLQRQMLAALGCEYAQGYLFSRPVSLEQAMELVRELALQSEEARHSA